MATFSRLVFADGFDRLSVAVLVKNAGIARSTFYEHFSGKDDVLRACMSQFLSVIASCVANECVPADLTKVLDHLWANRRLTDAIFSGQSRVVLATAMADLVEAELRHTHGGRPLILPYRLASIQIAEGQFALVESWLRGRGFSSPDVLASALHRTSRAAGGALTAE